MDTLHENNELIFLYKLTCGVTQSSYACKVAAAMGIDSSIIQRGSEVTELISGNKPVTRRESPAMEHVHKQYVYIEVKKIIVTASMHDVLYN